LLARSLRLHARRQATPSVVQPARRRVARRRPVEPCRPPSFPPDPTPVQRAHLSSSSAHRQHAFVLHRPLARHPRAHPPADGLWTRTSIRRRRQDARVAHARHGQRGGAGRHPERHSRCSSSWCRRRSRECVPFSLVLSTLRRGGAALTRRTLADAPGFLASIHRHLSTVFSLRAQPKGRENEDLLEPDKGIASFFLPTKEEGLAYVRCYFEHVRPLSPSLSLLCGS